MRGPTELGRALAACDRPFVLSAPGIVLVVAPVVICDSLTDSERSPLVARRAFGLVSSVGETCRRTSVFAGAWAIEREARTVPVLLEVC